MNQSKTILPNLVRISVILCWLLSGALTAQPAQAATQVLTVSPHNMRGWEFTVDNTAGTWLHEFALGPDTPPLGMGSAHLAIDSTARAALWTPAFAGTPLANLTEMQYSTYQDSMESNQASLHAITLQFDVDYDLTVPDTSWQGRLIFEPVVSGYTTHLDMWETWSPLAGRWWATGQPGASACTRFSPCTWDSLLSAFPNAGISNKPGEPGYLMLKAGGPWTPSFNGSFDAVILGINHTVTTFDMEPAAPIVYVDEAWAGFPSGSDPDGSGPATQMDYDAAFNVADGLNLASAKGQVLVHPGTYFGPFSITQAVTLQSSAGPTQTILHGGLSAPPAHVVEVQAQNVTIDGFTITNPNFYLDAGAPAGIAVNVPSNQNLTNLHFTNNLIHHIGSADRPVDNLSNNPSSGISVSGIVPAIEIDHNTITQIHQSNNAVGDVPLPAGIRIQNHVPTATKESGILLHDNTLSDISAGGLSQTGADGVGIFLDGMTPGAQVEKNTIQNIGGDGIWVGENFWEVFTIRSNQIQNCTAAGLHIAAPLGGTLLSNSVDGCNTGIQVDGSVTSQPNVNFNRLVNNSSHGLQNDAPLQIHSTNNWWGCNAGPGHPGCDSILGTAQPEPWLLLTATIDPQTIIPGGSGTLTVRLTQNSDGVDSSTLGSLPEGVPAAFSTTFGELDVPSLPLSNGTTTNQYRLDAIPPTTSPIISVTVDHQIALILVNPYTLHLALIQH